MSDEKNVNSTESADQSAEQVPAPKPAASGEASEKAKHPVSAALSRAEQKAVQAKAKVDAKLDKARAKAAKQRAKAEAKDKAQSDKAQKAEQDSAELAQAKAEKKTAKKSRQEPSVPVSTPGSSQTGNASKTDEADKADKVATAGQAEPAEPTAAVAEPLAKDAGPSGSEKNPEPLSPVEPEPGRQIIPAPTAAKTPRVASHRAETQKARKPEEPKKPDQPNTPVGGRTNQSAEANDKAVSNEVAGKSAEDSPVAGAATPAAAATAAAGADAAVASPAPAKAEAGEPASQEQEPKNSKAAKRRRKLEKIRAAEAGKEEQAPKAKPVATPAKAESKEKKTNSRRQKLDKAHVAASKNAATASTRKKTGAVLLSLVAVVAASAAVGAGSLIAPKAAEKTLPAAVTNLPAGDASSICARTPQLLKGVDGTDPQFAAGAKKVSSNLRAIAVSDLAKRIPGSSFTNLGGTSERSLTNRIDEAEAVEARGADKAGQTGRTSKISTIKDINDAQAYSLQPLGGLASEGSALRSYQTKDGDLAGLAAATCQAPASNWRFTGLQTSTGSTSVMHLSNPTHTTAQVAVRLRGPEGLIDTPTLQNIVLAPGENRALVLGGYAKDKNSVSAEVTSLGGKITASVQQAALRGLTPSGVDFVGANASASNTQVIPGVWIDSKDNVESLSKGNGSLIPQLHVSATGSSGAGFKVKVLGQDGEVAASFEDNLAVSSNATKVLGLKQLAGGYYTIVVESDAPVTAAARMVRGANPKSSSDTAWAVSSNVLAGTQAMPLSANGTGKFALAAVDSDSSVEATVVAKDGKLQKGKKLEINAGSSIVFDPQSVSKDAQAVIFSTDANTYIGQVVLGSERSIAWAAMPQANAGRDGIVVNIGG